MGGCLARLNYLLKDQFLLSQGPGLRTGCLSSTSRNLNFFQVIQTLSNGFSLNLPPPPSSIIIIPWISLTSSDLFIVTSIPLA